jgi:uncharacterized membrane protein YbhN (UPF0104 family)
MFLANIIFPAPATFYVIGLLMPLTIVAALGVEWFVFCMREKDAASPPKLLLIVIVANFWSWLLGMLLTWFMPSGLVPQAISEGKRSIITQGPNWGWLAIAGLAIAYFLSILIEYYAIRAFYRKLKWKALLRNTVIANSVSYPVYVGLAFLGMRYL